MISIAPSIGPGGLVIVITMILFIFFGYAAMPFVNTWN
jgi:hypothetical protein